MTSLPQPWYFALPRLGALHWCGLVFFGYASASLLWVAEPNWAAFSWLLWLGSAFCLGYALSSLRYVYLGLLAFMTVNVAVAVTQYLQWDLVPFATQYPAGFLMNSNFLACALALAMVAALCLQHYWFLPIGALGIYLTHSRGAIIALGAAGLLYLWPRAKVSAFVVGILALVLAIELSAGRSDSLAQRIGIWQSAVNNLTLFGTGIGSFADVYMALPVKINMTLTYTEHAYNDFLELLLELGIGAISFWLMFIFAFESKLETERLLLAAYVVLATTYFPLFTPIAGPFMALALGHISKGETHG